MSNDVHPALAASRVSMAAVEAHDRDAWVGNFAEDGVLQDPVGVSPLDPSGEGHHGREAIGAFWDQMIAPNQIRFDIERSHCGGDECANVGTITTTFPDGNRVRTTGVYVYRVDGEGRLASLRAFWQMDQLEFLPAAGPPAE